MYLWGNVQYQTAIYCVLLIVSQTWSTLTLLPDGLVDEAVGVSTQRQRFRSLADRPQQLGGYCGASCTGWLQG